MKRATWISGVACLLLLGGCEVVTGLSGARVGGGNNTDGGGGGTFLPACTARGLREARTFQIEMLNMPHVDQLLEVEVINEGGFTQGVAILDGLPSANYTVTLPNLLEAGLYRVDFWADKSGDRMYTAPPADHTWRRPIGPDGCFRFDHNANFDALMFGTATGARARLNLNGFDLDLGKSLEARLVKEGTNPQVIGLYRLRAITAATFSIEIPKIVDPGVAYRFEVYVDDCMDPMNAGCTTGSTFGRFEPEFDLDSWIVPDLVGSAAGLDATLSAGSPTVDLSYP